MSTISKNSWDKSISPLYIVSCFLVAIVMLFFGTQHSNKRVDEHRQQRDASLEACTTSQLAEVTDLVQACMDSGGWLCSADNKVHEFVRLTCVAGRPEKLWDGF